MYTKKSLYRVYRPKNFDEVVGHEYVKQILTKQIVNGNFSHAILLSGQRGTGKTSVAKIFAKTINCENLNGFNSCEKCNSCIEANRNSHSDIFEIDAASNNGIDEIRNIKNNVVTLPTISKYKIYIIDEVHMLTNSAFNALLKTLEEPPKHIIFILATTDFNKIPLTIISRCQTFNFSRINKFDLIEKIKKIAANEKIEIDNDSLNEIYYLSDGSLRDAINTLEQASSFSDGKISHDVFKKVFSIATKNEKLNIIKYTINGEFEHIINFFDESERQGLNFKNITLSLIDFLREIIEFRLTGKLKSSNVLTLDEQKQFVNVNIDILFEFTDQLVNVYQKTKSSIIDNRYLLISILKSSKFSNSFNNGVVEVKENYEKDTNLNAAEIIKEVTLNEEKEPRLVEENIEIESNDAELTNINIPENTQEVTLNESTLVEENIETELYDEDDTDDEGDTDDEDTNLNILENTQEVTLNEEKESILVKKQESTQTNLDISKDTIPDEEIDFNQCKLDFIEQYNINSCKNVFFSTEILHASTKKSSKEKRIMLQAKIDDLFDINNQNFNLDLAKDLVMFFDVKIVSANEDSIVILEKDSISAKILNNKLLDVSFRTKMFIYLDREFAFVVLNESQLNILKEEFRNKWPNLKNKEYEIDLDSFYFDIVVKEENDELDKQINSLFLDNEIKVID